MASTPWSGRLGIHAPAMLPVAPPPLPKPQVNPLTTVATGSIVGASPNPAPSAIEGPTQHLAPAFGEDWANRRDTGRPRPERPTSAELTAVP
jgi:hypothetical protein